MPVRSLRNSTRPPLSSVMTPGRSLDDPHYRAGARIRHQSTATEDAAEPTDLAHLVGHGDGGVELQPTTLDLLHQIVDTDVVRAGFSCNPVRFTGGENQDAHGFPSAMRQDNRGTHRLIGLPRIDTQSGMNFDRLVEVGERDVSQQSSPLLLEHRAFRGRSSCRPRGISFHASA